MSREGENWTRIPDSELDGFYEVANEILQPANDMLDFEDEAEVAAAFLYACARYNAFTMQTQNDDPSQVAPETLDYLCGEWRRQMSKHMEEQVRSDPGDPANPCKPIANVTDILHGLSQRDEDDIWEFRDLGDRFINAANAAASKMKVSRISAAFMHACTRFNVLLLQGRGHPIEQIDDEVIEVLTTAYRKLLDYHVQETLIEANS